MSLNIKQLWMGARTTRYHTDPHLTGKQNNADHQWGVAIICMSLCEAMEIEPRSRLLQAALTHDGAEFIVGDFPNPFKMKYPDFKKRHKEIEEQELTELGANVRISPLEEKILKVADSLEAIIFCSLYRPDYNTRPDWDQHIKLTLQRAREISPAVESRAKSIISMVNMSEYKTGIAA